MNEKWLAELKYNPLNALEIEIEKPLQYFVNRDLLKISVEPIESLWDLPEPIRITKKQVKDGSWKYPGTMSGSVPNQNYFLLQTFRNLRVLVERYGFTTAHESIPAAADYIFSCQTEEGDIRGILGNQYMPYYHGAILALLIKAGFGADLRVIKGLEWLLSMQQDDGGWIVPTQLVPSKERTAEYWGGAPRPPDQDKPHAHMATGMVLQAFAAHPEYCKRPETIKAGNALKGRILKPDKYNDRRAISYWLKFQYPFWWTNLVSTLDSLSRLGFDRHDENINRGLDWFITNQELDGLWPTGYGSGKMATENRRWVGLAICRILSCFY
jgi:hypothetical protein